MANGLREKAIVLRLQGQPYGQIKRELGVSKSTLSGWLKNLDLTSERFKALEKSRKDSRLKSKDLRIERYRQTRKAQLRERLESVFSEEAKLLPLSDRELYVAGLFLYWGEGEKGRGRISISNSNPQIVKFALTWMVEALGISKSRIHVYLHLYSDMDVEGSIGFWVKSFN